MKKIIIYILCILFASSSFAQMVGANSIQQKQNKIKYPVAKHEFSIHAGGVVADLLRDGDWPPCISGSIKYKVKPSAKYDIRLLWEVGIIKPFDYYANDISTLPILFGINYEGRLSKNWSIFTDLGFGVNVPLYIVDDAIGNVFGFSGNGYDRIHIREYSNVEYYSDYNYYYILKEYYGRFDIGFALSPEIGFAYKKFMFSFKYIFSLNNTSYCEDFGEYYDYHADWSDDFSGNYIYERGNRYDDGQHTFHHLVFTLGFRF